MQTKTRNSERYSPVPPGLLQLPASWPPGTCHQTLKTDPELVFNVPRYTHFTTLLTDLHWVPVIACIKFKTLVLAYQAVKGSAPACIQKLIRPYTHYITFS